MHFSESIPGLSPNYCNALLNLPFRPAPEVRATQYTRRLSCRKCCLSPFF